MRFSRMITVVGAHACGELNDVITGGVRDVPGRTMFEKMQYVEQHAGDLRQCLLNEPRGKVRGTTKLGGTSAILPTVTGKGRLTAFHHRTLDPGNPLPLGYRVGDTRPAST